MKRLIKAWRERHHLPPRRTPLPDLHPRRAADEAYRVARSLRDQPNEPVTLHAHTLADVYDMLGHLSQRVANLEDASAVRGVAQAYERTLP